MSSTSIGIWTRVAKLAGRVLGPDLVDCGPIRVGGGGFVMKVEESSESEEAMSVASEPELVLRLW